MATLTTPSAGAPELELAPAALNEPSMEDILASIRRIIAEDQSNSLGRPASTFARRAPAVSAEAAPSALVGAPVASLDSDVADGLDHHDALPAHVLRGSNVRAVSDEGEAIAHAAEPTLAPEPPVASVPVAAPPPETPVQAELPVTEPADDRIEDTPLISHAAGASITSSFHALAESVLLQDPAMIERVTRDMLRPMLKTWLDDNLPSIVERLVRAEIERVARGGRTRD